MPLNDQSHEIVENLVPPCSYTGAAACTSLRRRACERKGSECKAFREFSNSKYGEFNPDKIGRDVKVAPCGACQSRYDGCEDSCRFLKQYYGGKGKGIDFQGHMG